MVGVLLFTDSLEPSGVGEHMLTLAACLRDRYAITLACPPSDQGRALLTRAARVGVEAVALEAADAGGADDALAALLRSRRPHIFHAHAGIGWEGQRGCRVARQAGVPVVVRTEHLPYVITDAAQADEYHRALAAVDAVICVSQAARHSFVRAGVLADLVYCVPNGIAPTSPTTPRWAVRARLGFAPTDRLVLTAGRMTEQKGHRFLAHAARFVCDAHADVRFLWAGDGPLRPQLEQQIAILGLGGRVHMLGRRSDLPDLLAAADLFVLPSLFEGLPLVVLEAMAAGLPVVGTRVCGTEEAVEHGITGVLVPPEDADSLAAAICQALTAPRTAAAFGEAGARRVRAHFSATGMAAATAAVYESCAARVQPAAADQSVGAAHGQARVS